MSREERLGLAGLLALVAAVYSAVAMAGFVWDDIPLVLQNEYTRLSSLHAVFSVDLWEGAGQGYSSGYYRPFMLLSLGLDRLLWEGSAAGHHLHSLAWHLVAIVALFALARELLPPAGALVAVAVFALHPLQSEAVIWVAARNDAMAATFLFSALWMLLPAAVSVRRLVGGGLLLFCGLMSKESVVLAPALLLVVDLTQRRWSTRSAQRYVACAVAVGLWALLRARAGIHTADLPEAEGLRLLGERGHIVVSLYARLLAWPWPLSTGRTIEYLQDSGLQILFGWLVLLVGGGILIWRGRSRAVLGLVFAVLVALPSLLAVAGKGQLGERYLYLSMAGVGLALGSAWPGGRRGLGMFVPVLVGWIGVLHLRIPDWQNGLELWKTAVRDTPSGYSFAGYAHELNMLGIKELSRASAAEAEGLAEEAGVLEARARLHIEEAVYWFVESVAFDPPFVDSCPNVLRAPLRIGRQDLALQNLANIRGIGCEKTPLLQGLAASVLAQNGRWEEARSELPTEQDPGGRAPVVAGALALRAGETELLMTLADSTADPEVFLSQAQALLEVGNAAAADGGEAP